MSMTHCQSASDDSFNRGFATQYTSLSMLVNSSNPRADQCEPNPRFSTFAANPREAHERIYHPNVEFVHNAQVWHWAKKFQVIMVQLWGIIKILLTMIDENF